MEKGPARVDVVLLVFHQQKGCQPVDDNTNPGGPGYGRTVNCNGVAEFVDTFSQNGAYRHQQQDRVEQRDQD